MPLKLGSAAVIMGLLLVPMLSSSVSAAGKVNYYNKALTPAQGKAAIKALLPAYKPVKGATTRGINGHVITIGGVATVTAGGETISLGACEGAKARFQLANQQGGVDGYTFNYVGCSDDGYSATTSLQDVENLVNNQHAFAVIPYSSYAQSGAPAFLNSQNVPFFGWGAVNYCGWKNYNYA